MVNTLLFLLNSIFAAVLLLSYIYPYISPKSIPSFTILSLFVPTLIIINTFFFAYWLIRLKKQYFLSFLALLIGWFISSPVYKVFGKYTALDKDLKVMTFNVRTFNYDGWNEDKSLNTKAFKFITEKKPDIIAFQEFYESDKISFSYPYKFIKTKSKANKFGLAIYSKYKILNSGSLDFKKSANNIIFADVLKEEDTIRIYNVHLESLRINPKKENFGQKNSKRLFHRLSKGFKKQAAQTKLFFGT